uniref:Putative secreted protein n=1 Tax=Anopheles darlingi TaxID=43151 RepID=A0A2M4DKU9_ANODA
MARFSVFCLSHLCFLSFLSLFLLFYHFLSVSPADDTAEMNYQRTVNRRKTDLMPTIPSPRDSSRSSLGTHTPRTPGSILLL